MLCDSNPSENDRKRKVQSETSNVQKRTKQDSNEVAISDQFLEIIDDGDQPNMSVNLFGLMNKLMAHNRSGSPSTFTSYLLANRWR